MARPRTALLVTYTMFAPYAVGVFLRAVRIAQELIARGWSCTIYNYGPIPDDPKVTEVTRRGASIERLDSDDSDRDFEDILASFRRIDPHVVVFGEYPLAFMEPLLRAARALVKAPVLMLDQYYSEWAGAVMPGIDRYVMYGVQSLWPQHPLHPSHVIIPPFIERVTPREELPVPAELRGRPWVTIVGFEPRVLRAGIDIAARLDGVVAISMSADPVEAERLCVESGVQRFVALPLQHDAHYFGLIAASSVVVLANGFMQICEAVALGCPAIAVHRGIGMDGWSLHEGFKPFVHFAETTESAAERARAWLANSPFTAEQRASLQPQRGGLVRFADIVEDTHRHPSSDARRQRRSARRRHVWSWFHPTRATNANEIV
jgi:hypothetical protein